MDEYSQFKDGEALVLSQNDVPIQPIRSAVASICSLPSELLIIIFHILHIWYAEEMQKYDWETMWERGEWHWDLFKFPYNIAGTCQRWSSLASTVPEFWDRLIILVGHNPTPLDIVDSLFEWSKELPIYVLVGWRDHDTTLAADNPKEEKYVAAITDIIGRHLNRIIWLVYALQHPSSLPTVCGDLSGKAGLLKELTLRFSGKEVGGYNALKRPIQPMRPLLCNSRLRRITLNGRNFRRIRTLLPSLLTCRNNCRCKDLVILGDPLERYPDEDPVTAYDVFKTIQDIECLEDLCIDGFKFDAASTDHEVCQSRVSLEVPSVAFKNMKAVDMCQIFDVVQWSDDDHHLTISRCSIPRFCCAFANNSSLSFEDLPKGEDPLRLLGSSEGRYMDFTRCEEFDDTALALMSYSGIDNSNWLCPALTSLHIDGCPVTAPALRRLVRSRAGAPSKHFADDEPAGDTDIPPMSTLSVINCAALPQDLRRWFEDNLRVFGWNE